MAKSHNHGRWGSCGECYFNSVGVSHKDAEDKAMNKCLNSEVAKRKPELRCIVDRAVGSRPEQIRKERAAKQKEDIMRRSRQITERQEKDLMQSLANTCKTFGYKPGTDKYADCMKDLYLKNSQSSSPPLTKKRRIDPSVWDDLNSISQGILRDGKSASEALSGSSSPRRTMTCFKTGEETGGLNKICRYDCVGNLVTTTVGSAQICPVQIQR